MLRVPDRLMARPKCGMNLPANPAGNDRVGLTPIQHPGRFDQRRERGDLAQGHGIVRAAGVLGDAHVAGRHVGQVFEHPQREQVRRKRLAPTLEVEPSLDYATPIGPRQFVQIARHHVGPQHDAQPLGVQRALTQPGVDARHVGRREGQLDVAAHDFQALPRPHVLLRVEVGHLAAEGQAEGRVGVAEQRQPSNTAAAFAESRPKSLLPDTDRADDSHAGNDNVLRRCHMARQSWGTMRPTPYRNVARPEAKGIISLKVRIRRRSRGSARYPCGGDLRGRQTAPIAERRATPLTTLTSREKLPVRAVLHRL